MGNEERIEQWRAARRTRPAAKADLLDDTDLEKVRQSPRSDAADAPASTPRLPDASSLEDARFSIIERRRQRWRKLVERGMLLVALPLLAILLYTELVATKLYQGEAIFTVQTSSEGAPAPSAGFFSVGAANSTIADAFKAREFILSRPMMDHMEKRYGFMTYFASSKMDPLTRLNGGFGLNDDAYDYYRKRVRVAVDVQEGVLRLFVQARTPEDAVRFGNGILAAAEQHVKGLSDKISEDQISSLTQDVRNAERQVADARRSLASVQAQRGDLSPEQTATAVYQLISNLELQRAEAQRQRDSLLSQGLTDSPLLPPLTARVQELNAQIAEQRGRLVNPGGGSVQRSVNAFEEASSRKEIAQARWESTLNTLQQAYLRILEQRRYFVVVVGMSVPGAAAVRDILSITIPILLLIALGYALAFIVRQSRGESESGDANLRRVFDGWLRR